MNRGFRVFYDKSADWNLSHNFIQLIQSSGMIWSFLIVKQGFYRTYKINFQGRKMRAICLFWHLFAYYDRDVKQTLCTPLLSLLLNTMPNNLSLSINLWLGYRFWLALSLVPFYRWTSSRLFTSGPHLAPPSLKLSNLQSRITPISYW